MTSICFWSRVWISSSPSAWNFPDYWASEQNPSPVLGMVNLFWGGWNAENSIWFGFVSRLFFFSTTYWLFFLSLFLLLNYFWNFVCLLYCTVVIMHAVLLSLPIFIPDGLCCSFVLIKMPLFPFLIRFFLVSDPYYWQLLMHPVFILHSLSFPWAGILCYRVYSSTITASPPLNCILGRF